MAGVTATILAVTAIAGLGLGAFQTFGSKKGGPEQPQLPAPPDTPKIEDAEKEAKGEQRQRLRRQTAKSFAKERALLSSEEPGGTAKKTLLGGGNAV